MAINWKLPPGVRAKINAIVVRAVSEGLVKRAEVLDYEMSLIACHNSGCALDLEKLAATDRFNLAHDLHGIHRTIDHETGQLAGFFWPRCAMPVTADA